MFGVVNQKEYEEALQSGLSKDDALQKASWLKEPCTLKISNTSLDIYATPRFDKKAKDVIHIKMSARKTDDYRYTNDHATGHWGEFEEKINADFKNMEVSESKSSKLMLK